MKTKLTLAALLVVASISPLTSPHARADEQSLNVIQAEVEPPTHAQHFIELLRSEEEFSTEHVFTSNKKAKQIAMMDLKSLKNSFQGASDPKIVATKMVGDFSLSIINLSGDEKVGLMMVQSQDGWKFISESNFEVGGCGRMFDRRQFGAFFTLMMWAEDYEI